MVYILFADGFEDIEALAPVDILRRASVDVKLVGVTGEFVTSSNGVMIKTDCLLDDLPELPEDCEMLVLPGGKGVDILRSDARVLELTRKADAKGAMLAAICAAPVVLAELGLLNGRRAVCFPALSAELKQHGARVPEDEDVTHDRHIITARAAGASFDFALKLVAMLKGWAASEDVRRRIYYDTGFKSLT